MVDVTREIYWNIEYGYIIYFLCIPLLAAIAYGIYKRYRLWRLGQPETRLDNLGQRIWSFVVTGIVDGLIHRRFFKDTFPGLIHFLIFWGAIAFLLATAIDSVTHYTLSKEINGTHLHGMWGGTYLYFSLFVDILGILAIIGIIIAAYRRYIMRPDRLDNKPENAIAISLFFVIVLTGFIVEGLRIAYFTNDPAAYAAIYPALGNYDPSWAVWSPDAARPCCSLTRSPLLGSTWARRLCWCGPTAVGSGAGSHTGIPKA